MITKKEIHMTSEEEICQLISEHYGVDFDSIVAAEELGNHVWVTHVEPASPYDREDVDRAVISGSFTYTTNAFLNCLCASGKIPAGDYQIDCTW